MNGPIARSQWYHESERGPGAYLLVRHSSRRHTPGDAYAFYTIAIFDSPHTQEIPRLTHAHTGYLESCCTALESEDVPETAKAALYNVLSRSHDESAWKKIIPDPTRD